MARIDPSRLSEGGNLPKKEPIATERIYNDRGELVEVYTQGPNAGRSVKNDELVIQGEAPEGSIAGVVGSGKPKTPTIVPGSASTNLVAPDGTVFQDAGAYAAYVGYLSDKQSAFDTQKRSSQSAFDLMYAEFANYGLASLVEPLRGLVQNGISGDEFTLRLRETESYKKRFSANAERKIGRAHV